ncbi:MAG: glycoside hydrolase family 3 C-terminal domain-containing protein [Gammaproteobacteria bacterium]|nr:glycoside hydrolase family 3 C-terminal domain-containing protein [Gammaproteobacteria bacterium]
MNDENREKKAGELLARLSNEEKAALCTGLTFWDLHGIERLELPSIMLTDGPHGLRKQAGDSERAGLANSVPAVCFPSGAGLASSWNRKLLQEVGVALGEECLQERVSVLLGPGVNIKRSPLCGRNFEYFSEDPYLSGELAKSWIQGVQSQGVGTSIKHFAANNQESHRLVVDTIVDERTLREIYLPGFEIAVKGAQPWTVMCAYNLLNGTYLSENSLLLTDILKNEWGHRGLVVTDWGAANDRVRGLAAGLELDMPGNGGVFTPAILAAIESGELSQGMLDAAAGRVIQLLLKSKPALAGAFRYDETAHHALARRAAEEACVLLKNDGALLPLATTGSIAVIGEMARRPRYQGAGSSQITPTRVDIPLDEIARFLPNGTEPRFAPGYRLADDIADAALVQEALQLAREVDTVVVFAGLPEAYESEGFDRDHLRLPAAQLELVQRLAEVAGRLVLVLQNGSPVEMPFKDSVPAILEAYLGGQGGGSAVARVLFGEVNPGGRLAETFPLQLEDTPCHDWFPGAPRQVQYREGIWVGYRYYCSANIPVAFPFGHGLSYTTFEYLNLRVAGSMGDSDGYNSGSLEDWSGLIVECEIRNVGAIAGWEVAQLYIHDVDRRVHRPRRELKGFDKLWLEPGETRTVRFDIGRRSFAYWDHVGHRWLVPAGKFEFEIGASSEDIRLSYAISLDSSDNPPAIAADLRPYFEPGPRAFDDKAFTALIGHELPPVRALKPYHLNSTLGEASPTLVGRLLMARVKKTTYAMVGQEIDEKARRMVDAIVREMPLRSLVILSGGKVDFRTMAVLIHLMNRRFVMAIRAVMAGKQEGERRHIMSEGDRLVG